MVAVLLAALVLGSMALIVTRSRQRPAEKPVRVRVEDREDQRRR
jgi:hypothetical protein